MMALDVLEAELLANPEVRAEYGALAQVYAKARPLLKWAGGKTQLLGEIIPKIPKNMADLSSLFSVVARFSLRCAQRVESSQTATQN